MRVVVLERNQSPYGLVSFVQGCRSLVVQVNLSAEASGTINSGFAIGNFEIAVWILLRIESSPEAIGMIARS